MARVQQEPLLSKFLQQESPEMPVVECVTQVGQVGEIVVIDQHRLGPCLQNGEVHASQAVDIDRADDGLRDALADGREARIEAPARDETINDLFDESSCSGIRTF